MIWMKKEDTMSENIAVPKTEAQDLQKQEHTEERTIAGRFFNNDGSAWSQERGCEH